MLSTPKIYTDKQVSDALLLKNSSRKVSFRFDLLNKSDIKIGEIGSVKGRISYGEFRAIKRSATFELDEYLQKNIDYLSDQIRPWFILHMPDGVGKIEWSLGIFLLESPNRSIDGRISKRNIGAYDKTIIIDEDKFIERYFIAKGTNYVGAITKILSTSNITKIKITDSDLVLNYDKEFPVGTKKKEAIAELLNEINYTSIGVDVHGYMEAEPYISPSQRLVTHSYFADKHSIILPDFTEELDLAGRANVFTRVATNVEQDIELVSTFVNDDPLSPISTLNRGRRIVDFGIIENIANQEVLDNHTKRIAIESTSAYSHFSFKTALVPTHGARETLLVDIPEIFDSPIKFSETSWDMDLLIDGYMSHETRRVIQL